MLSEKPWNLERFLRVIFVVSFLVFAFLLIGGAIHALAGKQFFLPGSLSNAILESLGFHGAILLGTVGVLIFEKVSWSDAFGFSRKTAAWAMLAGFLTALVFLPVGSELNYLSQKALERFHITPVTQPAVAELENATSDASRAYQFLSAVVLVPIAEEILFRGILYGAIRQLGFRRLALWGSALLFGLAHGTADVFVPLTILGLMLAWLYEKTDNLLASITAHAVFNGANGLWMFYGNDLVRFFNQHFSHGQ